MRFQSPMNTRPPAVVSAAELNGVRWRCRHRMRPVRCIATNSPIAAAVGMVPVHAGREADAAPAPALAAVDRRQRGGDAGGLDRDVEGLGGRAVGHGPPALEAGEARAEVDLDVQLRDHARAVLEPAGARFEVDDVLVAEIGRGRASSSCTGRRRRCRGSRGPRAWPATCPSTAGRAPDRSCRRSRHHRRSGTSPADRPRYPRPARRGGR